MTLTVEEIWTRFATRLRYFIRGRVGDDATAEDILQTVFLRIHQRLTQLREPGRLESWVFQITRHAIVDHYRQAKNVVLAGADAELAPDDSGEADEEERDGLMESFRKMIEALPEPYQEAIRLTEFEGLTQQQLADRLNLSLSGAKSRVQRGRAMLKEMLLDCCRLEFDRRGGIIECEPRAATSAGEVRRPQKVWMFQLVTYRMACAS